jgi:hypothetical protein
MNAVESIIHEVVHQFADPNAFFRELVQNAIDAGSREIFISLEHDGTHASVKVEDFGEGMTREIVETKLTRLFASSKDNDLTKIGRFGIGFASVFAIEPELVVVDTARAGEQWRVLFFPDRTWELNALDEPLEGTRITIVKPMSVDEFAKFQVRAAEVIHFWCRFSRVPVYLEGEDIREDFDVDSPVRVRVETEGTVVVAGLVGTPDAMNGYYNRGLTMMESPSSRWPHMTFRIDSRYLEHTLTRDRVREDKQWNRVVEVLDDVYTRALPAAYLETLEKAAREGATEPWQELIGLLDVAKRPELRLLEKLKKAPIFVSSGGPISAADVQRQLRDHNVYLRSDSHVAIDGPTYLEGDEQVVGRALETFGLNVVRRERAWIRPVLSPTDDGLLRLAAAFLALHKDVKHVDFVQLDYPGSLVPDDPGLWAKTPVAELAASTWQKLKTERFDKHGWLALNVSSPHVQHALTIARDEPEFAVYLLSKLLLARTGIAIETDDGWMRTTARLRTARMGGTP